MMQTDWKSFLAARGAEMTDGLVDHFGNPNRELAVSLTGNILCDLSHYALLAIGGTDAGKFLHSQLINDIQSLDEHHSQLNGYCNAKGRLIANFRVFRRDDHYYIRFPLTMTDALTKQLSKYILRSKVTIEDRSDHFVRIGYSGPTADQALADTLNRVPQTVGDVVHEDNVIVIRIPGISPSYELYGDESSLQKIWTRLDVHSAPIGATGWQLIEILTGMPHIGMETTEEFVPQMINYQAIDGLSFKKGCYPGQEIVARMHYLGKLKKRMYLARVRTDATPIPMQEIFGTSSSGNTRVGNILNVAPHPDGDHAMLAVIQISDAESGGLHLNGTDGPKLKLQDLPYTVELKS